MPNKIGQEGLLVDFDTGILRRGHVLVHGAPGMLLTLGFGRRSAMLHRFACGEDSDPDPFIARCRRVAEVMEGDGLAKIDPVGAWTAIAGIEDRFLRRLAIAEALAKSGYDPDEPRDADGRWTSDGGDGEHPSTTTPDIMPAAAAGNDVPAMKQRFVDAHLADAQKAADRLDVPVDNILGLSALESGWGKHPFAVKGNNFFGIHYPAPFATGWMLSGDGKTKVATFASYADSLNSFVAVSGEIIQGKRDPAAFAAAPRDSGKFGIDPTTGLKVPGYVDGVAGTITKLRPVIDGRRP